MTWRMQARAYVDVGAGVGVAVGEAVGAAVVGVAVGEAVGVASGALQMHSEALFANLLLQPA